MSLFDKITGKKTDDAQAKESQKTTPVKQVDAPAKTDKPAKAEHEIATRRGVYGVLITPLITEKSSRDEQYNKYAFAVTGQATKNEISKAVETRYNVKPIKINVVNNLGKIKRFGRTIGKQKDWRKAIVTLPKGKSINVYEAKK